MPGMAFRTWAKLLGSTFGAAALSGAGQLGLAYGLGLLDFSRAIEVTASDGWNAQLAWVSWFAMTAAAAGGLAGHSRLPERAGAGTRLSAGIAAGLGAATIVPLTMQPAREAAVAGVNAVFVIGACAVLGSAAGIFAAYAALGRSAARWSLVTLGSVVWLIALVSVAPSLRSGKELGTVRLGVLDAPFVPDDFTEKVTLLTMPTIALVCGVVIGLVARRKQLSTVAVALAGLAGPTLLALAYLIAGPGSGRLQGVPYWAAMCAAGAGVLGSMLTAVARPAVARRNPATDRPGSPVAAPTPDRPPLPQRDAQPDSAIAKAGGAAPTQGGGIAATYGTAAPNPGGPLPGTGAAQAITGRATVSARASVAVRAAAAAQRPEDELRPSDTGVITMPPFNGFSPPQPQQHPGTDRPDGEISDWVNGLGRS